MTQVEEEENKSVFRMLAETVIRGGLWRVGIILLECCVEQEYRKVFHEISDTRGKWNWSCLLMLAVKILSSSEDRDCLSFQNQALFRFQHVPLTDLHCLCGGL